MKYYRYVYILLLFWLLRKLDERFKIFYQE